MEIKKTGIKNRGFASMDKERHKLVSSQGGKGIRKTKNTKPEKNKGVA